MASRNAQITLELVDRVTQNLNKVKGNLYKSQKQFKQMSETFSNIGSKMDNAGTKAGKALLGLGGALSLAISEGSKYDTSLRRINVMNGDLVDSTNVLDGQLKKIAMTYGISATKMAEGAEIITKAGFSNDEVSSMIAPLSALSKIEPNIPIEQTMESTMETMRILGLNAKQSKSYVDTLVYSANASAISVSEMQETIKQAGGMAKMSGMSVNELATAIQILGNKGVKAQYAGTALRASISNLYSNTGQAKDAMEALGITLKENGKDKTFIELLKEIDEKTRDLSTVDRIEKLSKLFGKEHVDKMSKLTEEMRTFDAMVEKTGKSSKGSAEDFLMALNPLQFTMEKIRTTGSIVLTEFIKGLSDLNEETNVFGELLNSLDKAFEINANGEKIGKGWEWVDKAVKGTGFLIEHIKGIGLAIAGLKVGGMAFKFVSKILDMKRKVIEIKLDVNREDLKLLKRIMKEQGTENPLDVNIDSLSRRERKRFKRAMKRGEEPEMVEMRNEERIPRDDDDDAVNNLASRVNEGRRRRRSRDDNNDELLNDNVEPRPRDNRREDSVSNLASSASEAVLENIQNIGQDGFLTDVAQDTLENVLEDAQENASEALLDRAKSIFSKAFKGEGSIKEVGVKKFIQNTMGSVKSGLTTGLTTLFPTLIPKITAGLATLAPIVAGAMPILIGAAVVAVGALLWKFRKPIMNGLKKLKNIVGEKMEDLKNFVSDKWSKLKLKVGNKAVQKASELFGVSEEEVRLYCENVKYHWNETKKVLGEKIKPVVEFVKDKWEKFKEKCSSAKSKWNEVKSKLSEKAESSPVLKGLEPFKTKCEEAKKKWDSTRNRLKNKAYGWLKTNAPDFIKWIDRVKEKWSEIREFLSHPIQGTIDFVQKTIQRGASQAKKRRPHREGLGRVPYDNYPANLHKDEMVLTRKQADDFRYKKEQKPTVINNNVVVNAKIDKDVDIERVANEIALKLKYV